MDKKTYEVLVALEERIDDILEFRRLEDDDMSTAAKAGLLTGVAGAGLAAGRGKEQLGKDLAKARLRTREGMDLASKKARELKIMALLKGKNLKGRAQGKIRRIGNVISSIGI